MTGGVLVAIGLVAFGSRAAAVASRLGRRRTRPAVDERLLLADLVSLGLGAGLGFAAAMTAAAEYGTDETGGRIRRRLRSKEGSAGPADELFALADRTLATGAPLLTSVEAYTLRLRSEARAAAVERARRLPIKLLFPLALLILPGFLLLTVAPAMLAGIDRLGL